MRLLFISRDDASTGPLAAAWARRNGFQARSAATHHPSPEVQPAVVGAVLSVNQPHMSPTPRLLAASDVAWADVVVVVDDCLVPSLSCPVVRWNLRTQAPARRDDAERLSSTVRRKVLALASELARPSVA